MQQRMCGYEKGCNINSDLQPYLRPCRQSRRQGHHRCIRTRFVDSRVSLVTPQYLSKERHMHRGSCVEAGHHYCCLAVVSRCRYKGTARSNGYERLQQPLSNSLQCQRYQKGILLTSLRVSRIASSELPSLGYVSTLLSATLHADQVIGRRADG